MPDSASLLHPHPHPHSHPRPIGRVVCVLTGGPRTRVDPITGKEWTSSFMRQPITGPVAVGTRALEGDEVTNKKHHGRPFQAVLMFAASHYPQWRSELDLAEMDAGGFGENLTIDTLTERDVCIGDHLQIGSAIFEVTTPRFPCKTIDRRWGEKGIAARVAETGRGGWYARVVQSGALQNGDNVLLLDRPAPQVTVAIAARAAFGPEPFEEEARLVLDCPVEMEYLMDAVRARLSGK